MLPPAKQPQKRFYKSVVTAPQSEGICVELDGRSIKTPAGAALVLPTSALGAAVAAEWDAQGEILKWRTLGLTKLANTAIDAVVARREEVLEDILKYAGSDLICYRAGSPAGLAERQANVWDPILGWVRQTYGAEFETVIGITSTEQPITSIRRLRSGLVEFLSRGASANSTSFQSRETGNPSETAEAADHTYNIDPFRLAALHVMTTITGSALLSLAHIAQYLTLEEMWTAAMVDEDWQSRQWGKDHEAEARHENRFRDLETASRMFALASLRT